MSNKNGNSATRKTVDKAMQILHAFSNDEPELTVSAVSERLDMHKSIVSRLVSTLCEWRMLERDPATKRVRLGIGALQLGMQVANQNELHRRALPLLADLVERTRHSANLTVVDGAEMLVIASVQSPDALRVILRPGDRRPLHATAGGKVFLAHLPAERARAILLERGLPRITRATITSLKELEAHLAAVRRSGVAWNDGESALGVGGVASGVFDNHGSLVAAIATVFPQHVVVDSKRTALANSVRDTAAELTAAFGGVHPNGERKRK
jgi:DNA-binding IclR family transcriptional regulator